MAFYFICSKITVNNQFYQNGDIIIVGIEDCDNLSVGLIKTILIKNNKVILQLRNIKPLGTVYNILNVRNLHMICVSL